MYPRKIKYSYKQCYTKSNFQHTNEYRIDTAKTKEIYLLWVGYSGQDCGVVKQIKFIFDATYLVKGPVIRRSSTDKLTFQIESEYWVSLGFCQKHRK